MLKKDVDAGILNIARRHVRVAVFSAEWNREEGKNVKQTRNIGIQSENTTNRFAKVKT